MFKNFGNVFKFSFKNAMTRGYKALTIILAVVLVAVPILIMLISASSKDDGDESIDSCHASVIYVYNELGDPDADFTSLNALGEKNYSDIDYRKCNSMDEALESMKASNEAGEVAYVLGLEKKNNLPSAYLIVPESKKISKNTADNYYEFMDKYQAYFVVLASGLNTNGLRQVMTQSEYKTYHATGYMTGVSIEDSEENNDLMASSILDGLKVALPFVCLMLMYFLIFAYGASISQSIVMEKSSKLMDTMLVSVRPEALCLGKFLASVAAGVLQMLIWIGSIILGFFIGNSLCEKFYPESNFALLAFLKAMGKMEVFTIPNVIIAVLILILGFILFASLAVVAGAISRSREEAASASSVFIIPLIIAFFAIMYGGGLESGGAPDWMLYIPFTAALITPAYVALGILSFAEGIISFGIMAACALVFVIIAGRLYKMMSLYKGNQINIGKAMRMLFTGQSSATKKQ